MKNNKVYVVSLTLEGVKHYFEHEEMGLLDPSTHKTIKKPMGYFTTDLKLAKKFLERWWAEAVSAGYEGSHVEVIKEGERLK